MTRWLEERRKVLETARLLEEKGLVVGTSGNVSLRIGREELLAITPHGRYYDELSPQDIVVIDFEAENVEGELPPSVESLLHIAIYRKRPDVRAVVHAHPPFASALAIAGKEIPVILDDQAAYLGGEVKLARYALPGSPELAEAVLPALGERNAVLIANHGIIAVGQDLKRAFTACQLVEKAALSFILASALGRVNELEPQAKEALLNYFRLLKEAI